MKAGDVERGKEKKKWQIALRRYVLEQIPSKTYAPYFGLDISTFRKWMEMQFTPELSWENFGKAWQFEHVIPVTFFTNSEEDLKLAWNFANIVVASEYRSNAPDILTARDYFQKCFELSQYEVCKKIIDRIDLFGLQMNISPMENFFNNEKSTLNSKALLNEDEFERMNKGEELQHILLEKEILTKFGS